MEALNKEGYWSDVIGYQKVDLNRRCAVVFKSVQKNGPLSYVYGKGWYGFVNYRGQMKTCRLCGDIEHLAKDCLKARRQQDFSQSEAQSPNASARIEINITEPDPDVLKSRLNDVFRGSVSNDPEDDAESISSIEEYQDVISEVEASKAWADAKERPK